MSVLSNDLISQEKEEQRIAIKETEAVQTLAQPSKMATLMLLLMS